MALYCRQCCCIALIILITLALSGVIESEFEFFHNAFGLVIWQMQIMLGCMLFMLLALLVLLLVLMFSKAGIVDKGIYTATNFLEWYFVYDFVIDENKAVLLISSDRSSFDTLKNISNPLRFNKNDTTKLKFILSYNKNKFNV